MSQETNLYLIVVDLKKIDSFPIDLSLAANNNLNEHGIK